MEISAKQLIHTKVYDSHGRPVCRLRGVILDPDNGQILAFQAKLPPNFGPHSGNLISPHDVISWKKDFLVLGQNFDLHTASDLVRVDRLLKSHQGSVLRKKVRTESGQKLGRVTDFNLNQNLKILSSITAQKTFLFFFHYDTRLIHQKNILEITPKEIIVKDSTLKIPLKNPVQNTPDKFSLQNSPTFDRALSQRED